MIICQIATWKRVTPSSITRGRCQLRNHPWKWTTDRVSCFILLMSMCLVYGSRRTSSIWFCRAPKGFRIFWIQRFSYLLDLFGFIGFRTFAHHHRKAAASSADGRNVVVSTSKSIHCTPTCIRNQFFSSSFCCRGRRRS